MPKAGAWGRAKQVCYEAAPERCPSSSWQPRTPSAKAATFVISSSQWLLVWEAQCLLHHCGTLAPTVSCVQEFPGSAAGHAKIRVPAAQHVMEKVSSCCSSPHMPAALGCLQSLLTSTLWAPLQHKTLSFPGQRLCLASGHPLPISPLRLRNRIAQTIQHVGTPGIYTASQVYASCPLSS